MNIKSIYIWALLLGTLTACQKQADTIEQEREPIEFKSFLKEGNSITPMTRALGTDLSEGYMLGGAWTTGAFLPSDKIHFIPENLNTPAAAMDMMMNVDGTPKDPAAKKLYWKTDGTTRHTFYAYTANPAETPAGYGVVNIRKYATYSSNNQQGACLWFRQVDDPTKQIDLLTADNSNMVVTPGATSAVNLYFQHRLSKVSIKVFGSGGANITNCQARLKYGAAAPLLGVGMTNIAGVFIVKDASGGYEINNGRVAGARHSGTYSMGAPFTISNTQANEIDAVTAGSMIFVPQPVNTEGWATVELEYSIDGSVARYTASVDLPAIAQLYPTKEYVIALNLIERSTTLTVANVRLVNWNSRQDIIDPLPGEYALELSATKPAAVIPTAGATYKINVTSNRGWVAEKLQDVTVSPISGKKGTTEVTITVPKSRVATDRSVFAQFSTTGAVESKVTAMWTGTQTKAVVEVDMGSNLIWAKGNLVADGANGCVIGEPTDCGVYFQFGSLIGWKGGKTGDGTGRAGQANESYYGGVTTFNAAKEVAVMPSIFTKIANIGATWPTNSTNLYYFGAAHVTTGSLYDHAGLLDGNLAYDGIGDPCRYYLGNPWRLPTDAEFTALVQDATITYSPAGTGHWPVGSTDSYAILTIAGKNLQYPASGYRDGAYFGKVFNDYLGSRLWTSTIGDNVNGREVYLERNKVFNGASSRNTASPIRCVRPK